MWDHTKQGPLIGLENWVKIAKQGKGGARIIVYIHTYIHTYIHARRYTRSRVLHWDAACKRARTRNHVTRLSTWRRTTYMY